MAQRAGAATAGLCATRWRAPTPPWQGPDLDAMRAIAAAATERSLRALETALEGYKPQLEADPIIKTHLATLYDNLLARCAQPPPAARSPLPRPVAVRRREPPPPGPVAAAARRSRTWFASSSRSAAWRRRTWRS